MKYHASLYFRKRKLRVQGYLRDLNQCPKKRLSIRRLGNERRCELEAKRYITCFKNEEEGLKEARIEVTKDSDGSVYFEDMPLVNDSTGVLYTKVIPITNLDVFTPLTMQVDVRDKSDQYLLTKVRFTAKK